MFGRIEPAPTERKSIKLIVEDEQALFSTFSPEDEFNESVKGYIRSKITGGGLKRYTGLTVVSRKPIDEDRFRSAVSNWVRDENEAFRRDRRGIIRMAIILLIFGSVLVVFNIKLQETFEVARYSLVPIMGSLALSRATGILIIDLPTISSRIKALKRAEMGSVVTFEVLPETEEAT